MDAFFFDIDDTLYDLCRPYQLAVHETFGGRYDGLIDRLFARSRAQSDALFGDYTAGLMSSERYYLLRNQRAFMDCGICIDDEAALRIDAYYKKFQREIELSGTIRALLRGLVESGTMCGIISNGKSETQWKKIRTLRLTELIPAGRIIVSGDVGCRKPDRAIFDLAAKRFALNPEETWYVGDTFENDIAGASLAGWKTIWLNRRNRQKPAGAVAPDAEVRSEEEMAALVRARKG